MKSQLCFCLLISALLNFSPLIASSEEHYAVRLKSAPAAAVIHGASTIDSAEAANKALAGAAGAEKVAEQAAPLKTIAADTLQNVDLPLIFKEEQAARVAIKPSELDSIKLANEALKLIERNARANGVIARIGENAWAKQRQKYFNQLFDAFERAAQEARDNDEALSVKININFNDYSNAVIEAARTTNDAKTSASARIIAKF